MRIKEVKAYAAPGGNLDTDPARAMASAMSHELSKRGSQNSRYDNPSYAVCLLLIENRALVREMFDEYEAILNEQVDLLEHVTVDGRTTTVAAKKPGAQEDD